jgi:hypothetical protein
MDERRARKLTLQASDASESLLELECTRGQSVVKATRGLKLTDGRNSVTVGQLAALVARGQSPADFAMLALELPRTTKPLVFRPRVALFTDLRGQADFAGTDALAFRGGELVVQRAGLYVLDFVLDFMAQPPAELELQVHVNTRAARTFTRVCRAAAVLELAADARLTLHLVRADEQLIVTPMAVLCRLQRVEAQVTQRRVRVGPVDEPEAVVPAEDNDDVESVGSDVSMQPGIDFYSHF